jgi:hypothetical protein
MDSFKSLPVGIALWIGPKRETIAIYSKSHIALIAIFIYVGNRRHLFAVPECSRVLSEMSLEAEVSEFGLEKFS